MAQIIDHSHRPTGRTVGEGDEQRDELALRHVTFIDAIGSAHTLVFHPEGTDVSGSEENGPRVVGEHLPVYTFETPEDAVAAFERGELQ